MLKILINNRTFFIVFLLWLISGALFQAFYSETELMFWVNRHHNNFLDVFLRFVTLLGEDFVWLGLLVYLGWRRFAKNLSPTLSTGEGVKSFSCGEGFRMRFFTNSTPSKEIKLLIITWLAKVFVSVSLKNIFNLPRPMEVYQNSGREIHLVNGVEIHHWQSFPSGHTMTAFAFACFVSIILKQKKTAIFALFIAILVGFSRIYLFQHFPRDVFAGGILGVGVVCGISAYIPRRLRQALPARRSD